MKINRRLLIVEKPFWAFKRQTRQVWRAAGRVWRAVLRLLNRDASSFTLLLLYSAGGAYALSRWPASSQWLGLHSGVDVALTAVFLLWAAMFLVWTHGRVQEWVLRWGPALLAAPAWIGPFGVFYAALAIFTAALFAGSLLLMPVGAVMMSAGMLYSWWRRSHGITVRCVRGDCPSAKSHFRDIEVCYACDCGARYPYLVPSYYGIRYHRCTCGTKLPAQRSLRMKRDKQGRTLEERMDKYCPHGHPWGPNQTALPAHFIAMVGGSSAGKTCFLTTAVEQLLGNAPQQRYRAQFELLGDRQAHQTNVDILSRGDLPKGTVAVVPKASVMTLKGDRRGPARAYLYDAAGELYRNVEEFEFFEDLTGIVVLIDPLGLPELWERSAWRRPEDWTNSKASDTPTELVFATLRRNVSRFLRYSSAGRTDVPVAVVIGKADVPAVAERVGPDAVQKEVAGRSLSQNQMRALVSDVCRRALIDWKMTNEIRALEEQFRRVCYFACSPLGRIPDQSGKPYVADRVLPPLVWLLDQESGAVSPSLQNITTGA